MTVLFPAGPVLPPRQEKALVRSDFRGPGPPGSGRSGAREPAVAGTDLRSVRREGTRQAAYAVPGPSASPDRLLGYDSRGRGRDLLSSRLTEAGWEVDFYV